MKLKVRCGAKDTLIECSNLLSITAFKQEYLDASG